MSLSRLNFDEIIDNVLEELTQNGYYATRPAIPEAIRGRLSIAIAMEYGRGANTLERTCSIVDSFVKRYKL